MKIEYLISSVPEDVHFAYISMFDANNIGERKRLLQIILKNPYASYLFVKNCQPNTEEQGRAFEVIKKDLNCCYLFLRDCEPTSDQKSEAFGILICDLTYAYEMIKNCKFDTEDRTVFHNEYVDFYMNTNDLELVYEYCVTLYDVISDHEKEKLIDLIYEKQDESAARKLLQSPVLLTEEMKDKLDSLLLIKELI